MLNRTVYADPTSDLVITIDTEIAMARPIHDTQEVHADDYYHSSSSGSDDYFMQYHHRTSHKSSFKSSDNYPYPSMAPNDIVRFPFAVIKISGIDSLQDYPSWLSKLCSSPLVSNSSYACVDISLYKQQQRRWNRFMTFQRIFTVSVF